MKKIIRVILIGLLSVFALIGCDDVGKFAGTYQGKDPIDGEYRFILTSKNDGYQLESQRSKFSSSPLEFEIPKEIGFLKKEGNYLVKTADNMKFFEIINKNKLKHLRYGNVYTKINDEEK